MSSLQLPLSTLEYFLNLLASFNPYLKDVLLNSAQESLVAGQRRLKWVQKTCWRLLTWQALSPSPLARLQSVSPPAHAGVALVQPGYLCMQMPPPAKRETAPWARYLRTGSGGWRKEGSALSIVDWITLEIFPWGITMVSDNKNLYKPFQCIIHIYTCIYIFWKSCSHLLKRLFWKYFGLIKFIVFLYATILKFPLDFLTLQIL